MIYWLRTDLGHYYIKKGFTMMKGNKIFLITALLTLVLALSGCQKTETPVENTDTKGGNVLTTEAFQAALESPDHVIVDTRLNDAFNGWALDGVSRGGHIKGAKPFSANWLKVSLDGLEARLEETLAESGISPDKHIVLYDVNGTDAKAVESYLRSKGFENISLYDLNAWANDTSLELVQYPNHHLLVPAVVVKDILDGKRPATFEDATNIKIVEASWGEEETSYANGHIPTAFHINTDSVEPPPAWMLADDATLLQFALDHGFTANDTVIVTGEEAMAAYRVAVVLRYMGVKDVRVLNGGTLAYTMAGYALETESHKPVPVTDFGGTFPGRPELIDTLNEVKEALQSDSNFVLVDNRTWEEHIGESSGYSYHDKKGRIPGSVYGYAGFENSYSLTYYRNIDNTMRQPEAFVALWKEQGIDLDKHLSFMCGSGWRAAEILYYADVYGIENLSLYSDGWIGWSNDPSNPVETGKPVQ